VLAYCGGLLVAAAALRSSLRQLGVRYLQSAHMTQRLLIAQVLRPREAAARGAE
jgi:hypothetical protein